MKAHRGVSILVSGILGLVLCQLFGNRRVDNGKRGSKRDG
jgi:hypothetical protein